MKGIGTEGGKEKHGMPGIGHNMARAGDGKRAIGEICEGSAA
jgi:hypothetical protein